MLGKKTGVVFFRGSVDTPIHTVNSVPITGCMTASD